MKMKIILLGLFAIILLQAFPVSAVDIHTVLQPDEPGPYHIGYFKVTFVVPPYGRYWATIRYPAIYDGWFAPKDISGAPYPGIVIANGFAGSEWSIKWIPKHLTSYGYVTICFTPPNKLLGDITQWAYGFNGGIQKLKSQNSLWFSPISGILDIETFGGIGLSMGGGGCIEATGALNSEIDTAVALAPATSDSSQAAAQNITVPTQIQVGNNDGMVPPSRVLPYYSDLIPNTSYKEYLSITGGNHIGFIDEFFARIAEGFGLDNPRGIEFEEQHRISRKYFTAWFQYYLKGFEEYYTYIFGKEAQNDLDAGIISDLRYNIP
jgi:predicted dienelactone hydrolase